MDTSQPIFDHVRIDGALVFLRSQTAADAEGVFPLVHMQSAVTDMLVWNGPADLDELKALYSIWRLGDGDPKTCARDYFFVIHDRVAGQPAGNCGVRFVETNAAGRERVGNIGYWLGEKFWGGGRMTEAVRLLLWLSFEKLGAASVEAMCLTVNKGSQRVLEKCGFTLDKSYDRKADPHGPHCGECELRYELTREDYFAQPGTFAPLESEITLCE